MAKGLKYEDFQRTFMSGANREVNIMPCIFDKIFKLLTVLFIITFFMFSPGFRLELQAAGARRVLVLYDSAGEQGWRGQLYSICLRNLLGHFPVAIALKEIENYASGEIESYDATFYLGAIYDNKLPQSFLKDVLDTSNTVCWLGYNFWQLAWSKPQQTRKSFEKKFGFRYEGLRNVHYPQVLYKGFSFTRKAANPDIGLATITDTQRAVEIATLHLSETLNQAPYIIRSGHLWYVADNPFAYVTMSDRYLIFADLLHDILGFDHQVKHRALVRIEDVHGLASPEKLREIADYLYSERIPFSVAVIPVFKDPKGIYNFGKPQTIRLSRNQNLKAALKYMVNRGGEIVLHGLTHQWDEQPNPRSGVSAEDYEFFRVKMDSGRQVLEGPLPEDSLDWVGERVEKALIELKASGLEPVAWETPHYLASEVDNRYFGRRFKLMAHRGIYFVSGQGGSLHFINQFFPYVIENDFYGQKLAPENLFCFATSAYMGEPPSSVSTILYEARLNTAVRDGWASFFFHWYQDLGVLKEIVRGIRSMGYEFVPLSSLLDESNRSR